MTKRKPRTRAERSSSVFKVLTQHYINKCRPTYFNLRILPKNMTSGCVSACGFIRSRIASAAVLLASTLIVTAGVSFQSVGSSSTPGAGYQQQFIA